MLEELPALLVIGAPSVASYLRLVPQHWAGAFRCWGRDRGGGGASRDRHRRNRVTRRQRRGEMLRRQRQPVPRRRGGAGRGTCRASRQGFASDPRPPVIRPRSATTNGRCWGPTGSRPVSRGARALREESGPRRGLQPRAVRDHRCGPPCRDRAVHDGEPGRGRRRHTVAALGPPRTVGDSRISRQTCFQSRLRPVTIFRGGKFESFSR